jgi:hypothetical protein
VVVVAVKVMVVIITQFFTHLKYFFLKRKTNISKKSEKIFQKIQKKIKSKIRRKKCN